MRRLKRISFFLYSCLLFAVGFYGHYKIEQWFYPGRQTIKMCIRDSYKTQEGRAYLAAKEKDTHHGGCGQCGGEE